MINYLKCFWLMKKSNLFYAAMATVALTACSGEDIYLVQGPGQNPDKTDSIPIVFTSEANGVTRANLIGADAADKLGDKFVVSGYKGSQTEWDADSKIVYDNFLVKWYENSANTTESNSRNWEYVGETPIKHAKDNGITSQAIKYWDYTESQYDFIAWSTGDKTAVYEGTPGDGEVLVSAITPATAVTLAYTFQGKAIDLKNCYIADLVTVKKSSGDYGQPVVLEFRQLGTKVRIGIYETVPGYSVRNVQFYSAAASDDASAAAAKLFTTEDNDIYTEGTYTVTYPTVDDATDADNNLAHVTFAPSAGVTQATTVEWGSMNYTIAEQSEKTPGKVFLGRSANAASYAGDANDNYYQVFLPNENGTNLNLRVNYTLESIDGTGEVINVKGATAQVPLIYTKWQPNFAYTYIFKISDKTNGHTGLYDPTKPDNTTVNSDPAGLYPITFDAVVVNAEDGNNTQETITTVSTPSITTYQKGSNVVNNNEYAAGNPIFVTVNDGNKETTPDLANGKLQDLTDKAALYTLEAGHTEAEVVDALSVQDDDATTGTIKGRSGLVLAGATAELTNEVTYGVDGNTITIEATGTEKKAAKFTPTTGTTYAFVYTKAAPTGTTDKFEVKTFANGDAVNGYYRYQLVAATAGDVQKGVKYYNGDGDAAVLQTVFIGQGVGNVYTRTGAGTPASPYVYTIARGTAVTGTTYYYTTDGGQTYTAAHNVDYAANNWLQGLYEINAGNYEATSDTAPAEGKAYYYKDGDNYIYCVFLPQQTTDLYVINGDNKVACGDGAVAVAGTTYFDKFTQNDGVYYVKIIKVQ